MRKTTVLLLLLCATAILAQEKTPQQLFEDATASYKRGDFKAYLAGMESLLKLRPGYPVVMHNYAGALALNNRPAEAVAQLGKLASLQVTDELDDHDFDSLRERDDFRAVEKRFGQIRTRRISSSSIAFRIPQTGLITESIAWDPNTRSFFVSSVRKRKILRIDARGAVHDFVTHDVWGVNGLALDNARRILWATSTPYDRSEGFEKKFEDEVALFAFNADSGALIARYDAPKGEAHAFDGVTVSADGTVFISDARGSMDRLRPGATAIESFVPRGIMRSPQASVLANGTLYVADYGGALWAVDPKSGAATKIDTPDDFVAVGIDGLSYGDGSLLIVQNGVEPNRVARLWLDKTGRRVERWGILEMNHPSMDEPTNGVVVGHDFFWIAASQGNKFDAHPPALDKLHEGIIMKTPLR